MATLDDLLRFAANPPPGDPSLTAASDQIPQALLNQLSPTSNPIVRQEFAYLAAPYTPGQTTLTLDRSVTIGSNMFAAVRAGNVLCELSVVHGSVANSTTIPITSPPTGSHPTGALVIFFAEGEIPSTWFGTVQDNVTDDTAGVQQAATQSVKLPRVYIDWAGQATRIFRPVYLPSELRFHRYNFVADPSFAPAQSNTAMFVCWAQNVTRTWTTGPGNVVTFSAGVPTGTSGDGMPLAFTGSPPGSLTAGQTYYITAGTRSGQSCQLSSTLALALAGTSDVTFPSGGSGAGAYLDLFDLVRTNLYDGIMNANMVAGVNILATNIQQQSELMHHRVVNAASGCWGWWIGGQQAEVWNFEGGSCDTGILFEGANMMDFFGRLDIEGYTTRAVGTNAAQTLRPTSGNGFTDLHVYGFHHEDIAAAVNTWDLTNSPSTSNGNCVLEVTGGWVTHSFAGGNFLYSPWGVGAVIRELSGTFPGAAGYNIVADSQNGFRDASADYHQTMPYEIVIPTIPRSFTSQQFSRDILMVQQEAARYGGQGPNNGLVDYRPANNIVSDAVIIRDTAGVPSGGFSKNGRPKISNLSAPAGADIATSTGEFWWQNTPGAAGPMFSGKDSSGTVVTGAAGTAWMAPVIVLGTGAVPVPAVAGHAHIVLVGGGGGGAGGCSGTAAAAYTGGGGGGAGSVVEVVVSVAGVATLSATIGAGGAGGNGGGAGGGAGSPGVNGLTTILTGGGGFVTVQAFGGTGGAGPAANATAAASGGYPNQAGSGSVARPGTSGSAQGSLAGTGGQSATAGGTAAGYSGGGGGGGGPATATNGGGAGVYGGSPNSVSFPSYGGAAGTSGASAGVNGSGALSAPANSAAGGGGGGGGATNAGQGGVGGNGGSGFIIIEWLP